MSECHTHCEFREPPLVTASLLLDHMNCRCWLQLMMAFNDTTDSPKYLCSLSAELLEKAEKELNEREKWRDRDIQALRDMVLLHKGIWTSRMCLMVGKLLFKILLTGDQSPNFQSCSLSPVSKVRWCWRIVLGTVVTLCNTSTRDTTEHIYPTDHFSQNYS